MPGRRKWSVARAAAEWGGPPPHQPRGERVPTVFRSAFCPVCGTQHGHKPDGSHFWSRPRPSAIHLGIIQESRGRGTISTTGYFDPDDDPDSFMPLIRGHLLAAIREWLERGWLTRKDVEETLGW